MEKVINKLINIHKTISTMESCTGGALASYITDIEGASEVFKYGAVTYSNEYKIKMGVDKNIIDKYTVYSINTAKEMSYKICLFAQSDYGVGITGRLNRADKNNPLGKENKVYISIYSHDENKYYTYEMEVLKQNRIKNKQMVIEFIKDKLLEIIK